MWIIATRGGLWYVCTWSYIALPFCSSFWSTVLLTKHDPRLWSQPVMVAMVWRLHAWGVSVSGQWIEKGLYVEGLLCIESRFQRSLQLPDGRNNVNKRKYIAQRLSITGYHHGHPPSVGCQQASVCSSRPVSLSNLKPPPPCDWQRLGPEAGSVLRDTRR